MLHANGCDLHGVICLARTSSGWKHGSGHINREANRANSMLRRVSHHDGIERTAIRIPAEVTPVFLDASLMTSGTRATTNLAWREVDISEEGGRKGAPNEGGANGGNFGDVPREVSYAVIPGSRKSLWHRWSNLVRSAGVAAAPRRSQAVEGIPRILM